MIFSFLRIDASASSVRRRCRRSSFPSGQRRGLNHHGFGLLSALMFGALACGVSVSVVAAETLQQHLNASACRWEVSYLGRPLLLYVFGTNQFKPYVKELYTLNGDNVLLDAPHDHLHHHGLMYAITVNGINFWEEARDPGVQKPFGTPACGAAEETAPSVWLTQTIHWVHNKDRWSNNSAQAALLIERRNLTLTVNETEQEVALRWQARFELGPATPKVVLSGATYHGLGLRFPRTWDRVARHQNSASLPYSAEQKEDVTPAHWSAISHSVDGDDVMVAVFARRMNAGKSKFFTMLDAFAYVSATQDLRDMPLEYTAGEQFNLDYLVAVYSIDKNSDYLNARADR